MLYEIFFVLNVTNIVPDNLLKSVFVWQASGSEINTEICCKIINL